VATAEALNHAGITDPYELYQHIHPSEVGTCLGSGMGGMHSLAQMFKEYLDEKEVQSDVVRWTLPAPLNSTDFDLNFGLNLVPIGTPRLHPTRHRAPLPKLTSPRSPTLTRPRYETSLEASKSFLSFSSFSHLISFPSPLACPSPLVTADSRVIEQMRPLHARSLARKHAVKASSSFLLVSSLQSTWLTPGLPWTCP
jgi:hypothetical protein